MYKCDKFFQLNGIEENQKLQLASLHLQDRAMTWFRWFEKSHTLRTWTEFSRVLLLRFSASAYEDPVGQLTKLKQWGSVRVYQEKFEELANKTNGLSEEFYVSCFVSGLKEEIYAGVKIFQPRTISQAMGLARLQEETMEAMAKKTRGGLKFSGSSVSPAPHKTGESFTKALEVAPPIKGCHKRRLRRKGQKGCALAVMRSTLRAMCAKRNNCLC